MARFRFHLRRRRKWLRKKRDAPYRFGARQEEPTQGHADCDVAVGVPRKDRITPFVCDGVISDLIVLANIWGWTLTWVNMTTAVGVGSAWNPHWTSHQIL